MTDANAVLPHITERRAFDIRNGMGPRLGFVVQLPDNFMRHRNEWAAFVMNGELHPVHPAGFVGFYPTSREACDAVLEEADT